MEQLIAVGIEPELRDETSTDANIPISMGIPAITVGRGGKEGKVYTTEEWFVPFECYKASQRDVLMLLKIMGMEGVITPGIPQGKC